MNFDITQIEKADLILRGEEAMENFFNANQSRFAGNTTYETILRDDEMSEISLE